MFKFLSINEDNCYNMFVCVYNVTFGEGEVKIEIISLEVFLFQN